MKNTFKVDYMYKHLLALDVEEGVGLLAVQRSETTIPGTAEIAFHTASLETCEKLWLAFQVSLARNLIASE